MARAVPQNHDFAWLALAFQDFFSARFLAKPLTFAQFVLIFRAPLRISYRSRATFAHCFSNRLKSKTQ